MHHWTHDQSDPRPTKCCPINELRFDAITPPRGNTTMTSHITLTTRLFRFRRWRHSGRGRSRRFRRLLFLGGNFLRCCWFWFRLDNRLRFGCWFLLGNRLRLLLRLRFLCLCSRLGLDLDLLRHYFLFRRRFLCSWFTFGRLLGFGFGFGFCS